MKPITYGRPRNANRIIIGLLLGAWLIALVIALLPLFSWFPEGQDCSCELSTDTAYILLSATGTFYVPAILILITNWRIYQIASKRLRQKKNQLKKQTETTSGSLDHPPSTAADFVSGVKKETEEEFEKFKSGTLRRSSSALNSAQFSLEQKKAEKFGERKRSVLISMGARQLQKLYIARLNSVKRKEKQSTLLISLIILSFFVCWGPFFVVYLLRGFGVLIEGIAFDVVFFFGYCNSAVNPVLYGLFNVDFKNALKRLLCKKSRGSLKLKNETFL